MMKALQQAISTLGRLSAPRVSAIDPRIRLVVTLCYIAVVLSVPLLDPGRLVWLFCFPIIAAEASGAGYWTVLRRSLWVLPLIVLIGVFNPIVDREPWWIIGSVSISRGWVTLISVTLRGLLSLQALLALIESEGFSDICRSLRAIGCPRVLVTQLLMLYRYIGVLMQEALTMHRAREARGFGRSSYPLKFWATYVGQLLLRSVQRSRRVNAAMEARGFDGNYRWGEKLGRPSAASWVYLAAWIAVLAFLRVADLTSLFNDLITRSL